MLSPYTGPPLDRASIASTLDQLSNRGYTHVHTAAIADHDLPVFHEVGFTVKRRLHLLSRPLDDTPSRPDAAIRTARRWDRREILVVDRAAFDDFWGFDLVSLDDAAKATPSSRTRVIGKRPIDGYALSGVAGGVGYLQRLAVHPNRAGHGLGSALLTDAFRWMRRRGARHAYVNTQVENRRALELYLRHGFRQLAEGLSILERPLNS